MNPIRCRMIARGITEGHRVASPLELLFDLTFVAAVGPIVTQLADAVEKDKVGTVSTSSPP